ncbi:MAG: F0F1 ATP synthase subunit alpha [bacterium]|nr:F0F1 ATP synthase subunit alpha [bacterium]
MKPTDISLIENLRKAVQGMDLSPTTETVGTVVSVGDGIARIFGMQQVRAGELVTFENNVAGVALNLEEDTVGVIVLGDANSISEGSSVKTTGRILDVPVGRSLLGRVVDPLGQPIDGLGPIKSNERLPVERIAPGVIERQGVDEPVQTGIKAIDAMIPIGRGQRELIIGDRQTGKTALALDTIINQRGKNLVCVYVAIGQKEAKVARFVETLRKHRALEHTIVISAPASASAALNYLAPYSGTAMAEFFMYQGQDALVIYDDLSKHAVAYRQISLLLRRPPGREAYPGDVFYLHSRLLERAAKRSKEAGGGSVTALPIIETQAGDLTAYVPTNVISITDGQIFLESDLFNAGVRPAVNVGLSVSRVGSKAQTKIMKEVSGKLRLDLAQFRELAAFAQFGSELDEDTQKRLALGERLTEILKQAQEKPRAVWQMAVALYAATTGKLNAVPVAQISNAEEQLIRHIESSQTDLIKAIEQKPELTDELAAKLDSTIMEFLKNVTFE